MTLRRSEAPLVRGSQLVAALRSSRETLTDLEGQLDALLSALRGSARSPGAAAGPLRAAADRVTSATRDAGAALTHLGQVDALARRR
jgi:hypothetical protein